MADQDPAQNGHNGAHSSATEESLSSTQPDNMDDNQHDTAPVSPTTTASSTEVAPSTTDKDSKKAEQTETPTKRKADVLDTPPTKREKIPSLKLRLSLSDESKPKKKAKAKETKKPAAKKPEETAEAPNSDTLLKSDPIEGTPTPSTPTTLKAKKGPPCPPKFQILLSDYPDYIIWGRLQVREFLIRFNDIISIGARHGPVLNDLTGPWNEFMYKHIITALLSVMGKDYAIHAAIPSTSNNTYNHPAPPMEKEVHRDLTKQIERIPAESERLWLMLTDYIEIANEKLGNIDPVIGKTELKEESEEEQEEETKQATGELAKLGELSAELDYEKRCLDLVGRLMTLVASTEQIRNALARDNDQREGTYTETVKQLNVQWYKKREELKQTRPNGAGKGRAALYEWMEVHAVAKQAWMQSVEQAKYSVLMNNRHRRHRMQPVGTDHLGNVYWFCQERVTGIRDLSSFILVEKAQSSDYPVDMDELIAYNAANPPKPKKKPASKKKAAASSNGEKNEGTEEEDTVVQEEEEEVAEEEEEDEEPPLLPDASHEFYHFSMNTSRPLLGPNQNHNIYMVTCREDGELLTKWLLYHMGEKDPTKPPNERDKFIQKIKQMSEVMLPRDVIAT